MRNLLGAVMLTTGAVTAEPLTIAALGDSLTQGYGLVPEQGLVPQLEAWLRKNGADVTLINAGVSGDTTQGGLSRVAWTLTPDVDAMIVTLGGNDLLRGIDPAVAKANLDGILAAGQAQGVDMMLVGMTAPGNYGPDYKRDFDAMYPELAAKYGAVYGESLLAPLSGALEGGSTLRDYMQGDGIHPNAKGVALIVETLGPRVLELVKQAAN
jgi:acyl-CoA thioesterase-1